jgi:hypothetical protein
MNCFVRYIGVIFLVSLSSFSSVAFADYIDANGVYVIEVKGYTGDGAITNRNDLAAMARAQSAGTTVFSASQYYGSAYAEAEKETEAKKKAEQEKYCKSQPAVINLNQQTCIYDAISFTGGESNKCSNFTYGLSWYLGISYSPDCRSYWANEQTKRVQLCNVIAAEAVVALNKQCP